MTGLLEVENFYDQVWRIPRNQRSIDSELLLKRLGFEIVGVDNLYYAVTPPRGWHYEAFDSGLLSGVKVFDHQGFIRLRILGKFSFEGTEVEELVN